MRNTVRMKSLARRGMAIVDATILLAKGLGINIIAEGTETLEQVEFLKSRGCFEFQGYYFSKPLTAADMATMLLKQFVI